MFGSLEGKRGRVLEIRNQEVEEIEQIGKKSFEWFIFFHNTKSSSFKETQKLYPISVLDGLHDILQI